MRKETKRGREAANWEGKRQSRGLNQFDKTLQSCWACVLVDSVSDILTNEYMHFHAIVASLVHVHNTT